VSARVFVIADEPRLSALLADLTASGFDAEGDRDPRRIRDFAAAGDVHAVLVPTRATPPSAEDIARALRRALTGPAVLCRLAESIEPLPTDSPFGVGLRYPVARPVLADRLRRAIVEAWTAPAVPNPAFLADVEIRHARLERQNHYEVLGVGAKAPTDRIRDAYDRLALQFHPDRVRDLRDPELSEKVAAIYARAAEAWRALREPADRLRYDRGLAGGGAAGAPITTGRSGAVVTLEDLSANPNTRKYLRLAQVAIANRNPSMAVVHLRFAASIEPGNELIAARLAALEASAGSPS
jgi:hypothetical protein